MWLEQDRARESKREQELQGGEGYAVSWANAIRGQINLISKPSVHLSVLWSVSSPALLSTLLLLDCLLEGNMAKWISLSALVQ